MKIRLTNPLTLKTVLASSIALSSLACGNSQPDTGGGGQLLTATKPTDAETERLRLMQRVRLVADDGSTWDIGIDDGDFPLNDAGVPDSDGARLLDGIWTSCGGRFGYPQLGEHCSLPDTSANLCFPTALEQMALGDTVINVAIQNPSNASLKWTAGPQPTAARVSLLRTAHLWYMRAANKIVDDLTSGCHGWNGLGTGTLDGTIAAQLGADLVELQKAVLRSSLEFADASAAAADAQRRQGPSLEIDADRVLAGSQLSRAEAAHMLVGGPAGFNGSNKAACRHKPLTASAKKALAILRDAGVSPEDVLAVPEFQGYLLDQSPRNSQGWPAAYHRDVPTANLLDGIPAGVDAGANTLVGPSVAARLTLKLGHTVSSVLQEVGLGIEAFEEARYALAEELMLYGKHNLAAGSDPLHPKDKVPRPNLAPSDWPYAATSTAPDNMPPAFYAATLRTPNPNINSERSQFDGPVDWDSNWNKLDDEAGGSVQYLFREFVEMQNTGRTLAAIRWFAARASTGNAIGGRATYIQSLSTTTSIRTALAPFVATLLSDQTIIGRLNMVVQDQPHRIVNFLLDGFKKSDKPTIVRGEAGLMCATTGSIWGAPCDMASSILSSDFSFNYGNDAAPVPAPGETMFDNSTNYSGGVTLPDHIEHWYLVIPKDPTKAMLGPGDYKSILGFVPDDYIANQTNGAEQWWPIAPSLETRAAELIETQPDECSMPAVDCSGARFDERIALEDELSSDGTDIESSWKTYLTRAKDAATTADSLAEAYLQSGISTDQWTASEEEKQTAREQTALGELEKLQGICGTSVSPDVLLNMFTNSSGQVDLTKIYTNDTSSSPCSSLTPAAGTTCIAGVALTDWVSALTNADGGQGALLADCLKGLNDAVPIMALGDKLPCAWKDNTNGVICAGATTDMKCPQFSTDPTCANLSKPTGTTWLNGASDRQTMNLFSNSTDDSTSSGPFKWSVCAQVRQSRRQPGTVGDLMLQSNVFSHPVLSDTRKRLGIRAELGGYVTITLDGAPKYTTGSMSAGAEGTNWPCGIAGIPADCPTTGPDTSTFRCNYVDNVTKRCTNNAVRGTWNHRLMAAYAIAQATTWRAQTADDRYNDYQFSTPTSTYGNYLGVGPRTTATWNPNPLELGYISPSLSPPLFFDSYSNSGITAYSASYSGLQYGFFLDAGRGVKSFEIYNGSTGACHCQWSGNFCVPTEDNFDDSWWQLADKVWTGMAPNSFKGGFVYAALATKSGANATGDWPADEGFTSSIDATYEGGAGTSGSDSYRLDYQTIMDAAEMLCEAGETSVGAAGDCSVFNVSNVQSVADMATLSQYLQCTAHQVEDLGQRASFVNFPTMAVDPMQKSSTGVYVTEPGEIGQAYSDVRNAALDIATSAPIVSGALKALGEELTTLKKQMEHYDIQDQIADVKFQADTANAIASCAGSFISAIASLGTQTGGAVAACGNLAVTLTYGDKLRDLGKQDTATEREIAISNFRTAVNIHITTLQTQELKVLQGLETLRARLGKVESLKQDATKSLQNAIWSLSQQSSAAAEVTTVLGKHQALEQERYRRAHGNAVKLAYLAKRGIEQRLGMNLSDIAEDMPLVDAPANWESSICASSPIDYSALKASGTNIQNVADAFVGDYVTKLENVVDSYRLKYSFHEGTDVLVTSLRDDVMRVKTPCEVNSKNLLLGASQMNQYQVSSPTSKGWVLDGCKQITTTQNGVTTTTIGRDCVSLSPASNSVATSNSVAGAPLFNISFNGNNTCTTSDCGYQTSAMLAQYVTLTPGKYVLSWYSSDNNVVSAGLWANDGTATWVKSGNGSTANGLTRYWQEHSVTSTLQARIGFTHGGSTTWNANVGAPMLERIDAQTPDANVSPGVFEDADSSGKVVSQVCPDKEGSMFRLTRWRRGCEVLCPNGYQDKCDSLGTQSCYWETSIHIRQKDIEDNSIFTTSGFARGNFNYRIQSLALNFVGTGLQQCDGSSQACFANGYIPYTIIHDGPYYVRNHLGDDFEAKLFTGRIEHARGLAAERYITNPISSTDLSLLQSYMRPEFSGRPLDGTFIIRVWDENNINFDAIQDVQLVMNYRYWTRFQ